MILSSTHFWKNITTLRLAWKRRTSSRRKLRRANPRAFSKRLRSSRESRQRFSNSRNHFKGLRTSKTVVGKSLLKANSKSFISLSARFSLMRRRRTSYDLRGDSISSTLISQIFSFYTLHQYTYKLYPILYIMLVQLRERVHWLSVGTCCQMH